MHDTGAICQIRRSYRMEHLLGPKRAIFSTISHYKNSDAMKYSIWATFIENVVLDKKKCAVSPKKNAVLKNGT